MSDLRLEDTVFEHLKKTFFSLSDRMEDARRDLRGADSSAVGARQLIEETSPTTGATTSSNSASTPTAP
jgi:hypothetical protein